MGIVLLGVGALRIVVALAIGDLALADLSAHLVRDSLLVLVYLGAFALAGAVLGAGWGLKRTSVGRYALGYLVAGTGSCVLAAVAAASEPTRAPLLFWVVAVAIMTLIFGTGGGIMLRDGAVDYAGDFLDMSLRRKVSYTVALLAVCVLLWLDLKYHIINR
jgi:hypothetical protein